MSSSAGKAMLLLQDAEAGRADERQVQTPCPIAEIGILVIGLVGALAAYPLFRFGLRPGPDLLEPDVAFRVFLVDQEYDKDGQPK